ncbi:MAG TPA: hypothetical protein VN892_12270 [Solirubrobacteraceae bacterium]|nr:hypothetical protein [Solirubrobacteraceae bacterium]
MPDENPILDQERKYDAIEIDVIYLLTAPDEHPPIWSVADVGRQMETGDPMAVLRPLCCAGLIHRTTDDFVFATPAAYKMVGLVGRVG